MSRALRSLLFIPGDSDKKLGKVAICGSGPQILQTIKVISAINTTAGTK